MISAHRSAPAPRPPAPRSAPLVFSTPAHCSAPLTWLFDPRRSVFCSAHAPLQCSGSQLVYAGYQEENSKLHIASPMVTRLMTSRDHERSRSWPQYLWSLISQKPCEIDGRLKLTTYRKPHITNPMVTWQMTSHDPKRSKSWPQNLWSSISQQPCEIHGQFILTNERKPHIASRMVTWPMTSRQTVDSNWASKENCMSGVQWLCDWSRNVTLKGQGRDPKTFEAQFLNSARYVIGSY